MPDSIENLMRSIVSANQQSRARFEKAMSQTADAIYRGDLDELGNIVRDATGEADDPPTSGEGSPEPVETGNADGVVGDSVSAGSPADEPEESGS